MTLDRDLADRINVTYDQTIRQNSAERAHNPWKSFWPTLILLLVSGGSLMLVAHYFGNREVRFNELQNTKPRVTHVRPENGETGVLPDAAVAIDVRLPRKSSAEASLTGIDPKTLFAVNLIDALGNVVDASIITSAAGDALTISPREMLKVATTYRLTILPGLTDTQGTPFEPFESTFTTAAQVKQLDMPVAFSRTPLTSVLAENRVFTCLAIGPDQRLYAGTFSGEIIRYDINTDGTLANEKIIRTIQAQARGPRLITGITFDFNTSPGTLALLVSHGQMVPPNEKGQIEGAEDFTGSITLLTGSDLQNARELIIGLPRGFKDHLNFQMCVGTDGEIYFNQGSHTSIGSPDNKWGQRPERLLTAAILRLDLRKLDSSPDAKPLDVRTGDGASYDPYAKDAPLTIYATGVRSGFDILLHSNGTMYSSVNGAAAGGNLPERPASDKRAGPYQKMLNKIDELDLTTDDTLIAIKQGRYYGHPNPRRDEYVLNGGNPTREIDADEVSKYPIGTMPEANFELPVMTYGKNRSANGMVEFKSDVFGSSLRGAILVTRFSAGGDIIALFPSVDAGVDAGVETTVDGRIEKVVTGIEGFRGLTQPLDIVLDERNGNLYVTEYGTRGISLLRPLVGKSSLVFVQTP